jgi:hypothetical protein
VYAPVLFGVMTFVFALPGARGGWFHSGAALLPFWAALGVLGLDDVVEWAARRRRWRVGEARWVFGAMAVIVAGALTWTSTNGKIAQWRGERAIHAPLIAVLQATGVTEDTPVIITDPPALYYFSKIPGVPVPNAPPDRLAEIGARYGARYLVLDYSRTPPLDGLWQGSAFPDFLALVYDDSRYRIFRITPP